VKLLLKSLLFIAGALLILIAIYGFFYFVKDLSRMIDIVEANPDTSLTNPANFPRPQLYIVGFVDSLEHLTLGLLSIFAATRVTIVKK
jgi:hypothetical protein